MLAPVSYRKSAGGAPFTEARSHTWRPRYSNGSRATPSRLSQCAGIEGGAGGEKRAGSRSTLNCNVSTSSASVFAGMSTTRVRIANAMRRPSTMRQSASVLTTVC